MLTYLVHGSLVRDSLCRSLSNPIRFISASRMNFRASGFGQNKCFS